jgi:hypothetical protein
LAFRIQRMIEIDTRRSILSFWRERTIQSPKRDDILPENLKRAFAYYQNWRSFYIGSVNSNDHKFKNRIFSRWRDALKERKLIVKLHSMRLLPINTNASIIVLTAFDDWREALDFKRRQRETNVKCKEKVFSQWRSLNLRHKTRSKMALFIETISVYKFHYAKWTHGTLRAQKLDKLGMVAWYQRLVGDSFVSWRKKISLKTSKRQIFRTWRNRLSFHEKAMGKSANFLFEKRKARTLNSWRKLALIRTQLSEKGNGALEAKLRNYRNALFAIWRGLTDERLRQNHLAARLYASQVKVRILKLWNQSSSLQKVADEHLKGNLFVKGLFWWRAAAGDRQEKREVKRRYFSLFLLHFKSRRSTRFFFGQIMLQSIGKYQPSSKAFSILLPSPALPPSIPLSRSKFDEARNRARCFYHWLHRTRKAKKSRQLAVEYRKIKFAKFFHKWRSLQIMRTTARNSPHNLKCAFFKKWMARCRITSTSVSKADRKYKVPQ